MKYAGLVKHRPSNLKREYTGAYWGSQKVSIFPAKLTEAVKKYGAFVDLTAGGAQYPFVLAEDGVSTHVNDRNVYAISNHAVVFAGKGAGLDKDREEWFEVFCETTHPDNIQPAHGYASTHVGVDQFAVSPTVAAYIDGLLSFKNSMIRATVGRTLVKACSFRAYWWTSTQPNKQPVKNMIPEEFWIMMMRAAWILRLFAERIKDSESFATSEDALDAVQTIRDPENTIVYTDPAWPWAKRYGIRRNPYEFFTNQIGSILKQKAISVDDINFWSNDNDERTIADVVSWIEGAFDRGCPYFCLSTQDTNSPSPEQLYARLKEKFKLVWLTHGTAKSYSANRFYQDYFGMFKA